MSDGVHDDFDVRLLASLDAILQERSVSRAAVRLQLSQPSLSRALARLREHFDDQLLVRRGNSWELTPFAQTLTATTTTALAAVERVFRKDVEFDPELLEREFSIFGSDYTHATVGRAATDRAAVLAPRASFRFMNNAANRPPETLHLLESNDATMLPTGALMGARSVEVLRDRWVWLAATTNGVVGDELTIDDLRRLPLVLTHQTRRDPSPAVLQLRAAGVEPRIACIVDGFLTVPMFIWGTDRLALVPGHLAGMLVQNGGLRILECPYESTGLTASLYWHARFDEDAAHVWMRTMLAEVGRRQFSVETAGRP
ncbi:LysR family transcriptional regulator [uncultured Amnibacterium sp.]|uniref:LysR family transcriptional regulator n=1 Tax=uncultured Amnibacterium sp. TaxID=1631851 RepID=UPI0035CAB4DD